ncbi:MAG: restriction endonuclease, partial [Treponemataceae bacterium]|nr:restriction endonuclease [Treponemataceae bacterium]
AMGYATQTAESKKWGVLIIAAEKTEDWKNVRKQMSLIAFFRETNPLDEPTLRNLVDQAKPRGCSQTIICTSSGFTSTATGFAENRPVELVAKEKLEQMLAKAGV